MPCGVDPRSIHVAQRTIYSVQWDVSETRSESANLTLATKVGGCESCIFDSLDGRISIRSELRLSRSRAISTYPPVRVSNK